MDVAAVHFVRDTKEIIKIIFPSFLETNFLSLYQFKRNSIFRTQFTKLQLLLQLDHLTAAQEFINKSQKLLAQVLVHRYT